MPGGEENIVSVQTAASGYVTPSRCVSSLCLRGDFCAQSSIQYWRTTGAMDLLIPPTPSATVHPRTGRVFRGTHSRQEYGACHPIQKAMEHTSRKSGNQYRRQLLDIDIYTIYSTFGPLRTAQKHISYAHQPERKNDNKQ